MKIFLQEIRVLDGISSKKSEDQKKNSKTIIQKRKTYLAKLLVKLVEQTFEFQPQQLERVQQCRKLQIFY